METNLTCAILAGGLGTRLRSVLPDLPKPMASVRGRPFLEYLLAQLANADCSDVILCVGHRAGAIEEYFGDGWRFGMTIHYSREGELRGTAGALAQALPLIGSDPGLVMNGDSFCAVDIPALVARHRATGAAATLTATWVEQPDRFGRVLLGAGDEVVGFREKDRGPAGYINGGVYVLNCHVLDAVPRGRPCSLEREVLPALVGHGLFAFPTSGAFIDIGIPADLLRAAVVVPERRRAGRVTLPGGVA